MAGAIGVRIQALEMADRAVILAQLAEARAPDGLFAPKELDGLFADLGVPGPKRMSDLLRTMDRNGLVRSASRRGYWRLTPRGRARAEELVSRVELAMFTAEAAVTAGSLLGLASHPVIPPSLAPPTLLFGLKSFLEQHPFETNVFAMTRFPDATMDTTDPVSGALRTGRTVCAAHGLELHVASDRAINDDLWTNVAAHMWASRYGVAIFEDRLGKGVNYNLTIEVGAMLMTGRRCALLKDSTIESLPTDLVGRIYKSVDLNDVTTVSAVLHAWIRDDLSLGSCSSCPPR